MTNFVPARPPLRARLRMWKQRHANVVILVLCGLVAALAVGHAAGWW